MSLYVHLGKESVNVHWITLTAQRKYDTLQNVEEIFFCFQSYDSDRVKLSSPGILHAKKKETNDLVFAVR